MDKLVKSGYCPVNGLNMYYEIHGTGEIPLVLIHGGGSTIETSFANILPYFSKHYKVIALELQAHGRTSDRDAPETFAQDVQDVVGLLANLNISKANFLGFSNGGTTALQLAIGHPELVNKLIIVSANYNRDGMIPGFFDGFENATLNDMPIPLREGFLRLTPDPQRLQNMFEKDRDRMKNFEDISEELIGQIKAPALIMGGDRDVMTVAHLSDLASLIPNASLVILPGIHGSLIGEVCSFERGSRLTELTTLIIQDFLSK